MNETHKKRTYGALLLVVVILATWAVWQSITTVQEKDTLDDQLSTACKVDRAGAEARGINCENKEDGPKGTVTLQAPPPPAQTVVLPPVAVQVPVPVPQPPVTIPVPQPPITIPAPTVITVPGAPPPQQSTQTVQQPPQTETRTETHTETEKETTVVEQQPAATTTTEDQSLLDRVIG